MYQRYYDGYDSCDGCDIIPAQYEVTESDCDSPVEQELQVTSFDGGKNILGPLALDDILLIGVLVLLLHEECDDKPMLIIIGLLLLSGFIN